MKELRTSIDIDATPAAVWSILADFPVYPRTRFLHHEQFRGLLVPFLWGGMEASTRGGFEAMNDALKRRAEAGA